MEVTNLVSASLNAYFDSLKNTGYVKYSEVEKLLVAIFIDELFTSEYQYFITEEDLRYISKAYSCLRGCHLSQLKRRDEFPRQLRTSLGIRMSGNNILVREIL